MHVNFKNSSLLLLAITAIVCSRIMFAFFHDPEGPNLLVVTGMAAVIYFVSSAVYLSNFYPSLTGFKRGFSDDFHPDTRRNGLLLGIALRSVWSRMICVA
jgi:hypothetical protein